MSSGRGGRRIRETGGRVRGGFDADFRLCRELLVAEESCGVETAEEDDSDEEIGSNIARMSSWVNTASLS